MKELINTVMYFSNIKIIVKNINDDEKKELFDFFDEWQHYQILDIIEYFIKIFSNKYEIFQFNSKNIEEEREDYLFYIKKL